MSRVARLSVDCGFCASVDVTFDFICSSVNLNLQNLIQKMDSKQEQII